MKQISKIGGLSRETGMLQDRVVDAVNPVLRLPLLDGHFLTEVELTAGTNLVEHLLQRKLTGWILTRVRAAATDPIYDTQDTLDAEDQEVFLSLVSQADCVVDLWVF